MSIKKYSTTYSGKTGFTIVELLIVIVVIAILAAISIVAYNGIQSRAKASEASYALSQAKKKLELYKVDNGSYPTTGNLSAAGITDSDVAYQYTSSTGASYCITGTAGTVSYKASDTSNPTAGGCAGHGQGGSAAITNLAVNPSFESGLTGVASYQVLNTRIAGGAFSGNYFLRSTRNSTANGNVYGPWWDAINVGSIQGGETYYIALAARTNTNHQRSLRVEWRNGLGADDIAQYTSPSSSWSVVGGTITTPTGATEMRLTFYSNTAGAMTDYVDIDGVIIVKSPSSQNFADGNSLDWTWNGTPNNSSSTGPPL